MSKHIVDAHILPLDGKHYGTNIVLALDNGETMTLNVWISRGEPSDEALKEWGTDRAGWNADVEVDNGWGGTSPIQNMFPCDSHYQSQYELELCQEIVKAVRGE